nr:uncharacterized protein LOC117281691 isoform X2 [Nicotiana tomentosiformis]
MLPLLLPIYVPLKLIDTNDKVPSSSPVVGSRQREAEIELKYVYATNSLPDLRTFGENLTFSLETNATESKEVKFHSSNRGSYIQPLCIEHINLVIQFSWDPPRYESTSISSGLLQFELLCWRFLGEYFGNRKHLGKPLR